MDGIYAYILWILLFIFIINMFIPFLRGIFHSMKSIKPDIIESQFNGIQYVGHGTVFVQLDGIRILTDPILQDTITGGIRRFIRAGIDYSTISKIQVVIISHWHRDHFQIPSLLQLPKECQFIVPIGLKTKLIKAGIQNVNELAPGQVLNIFGIEFHGVFTNHYTAKNALGYVLKGSKQVYFAGDTAFDPEMFTQIGKNFSIDLALLPIGCYEGRLFGLFPISFRRVHLAPDQIPDSLTLLNAKLMIPIHWGTFIIGTEPIEQAITELQKIINQTPLPIQIVPHGKWWHW